MAGPLDGIRIIDLSQMLSGPYASLQLSDQGADVVKVEPPGMGDSIRASRMFTKDGISAFAASINRGKRSIQVDLTTEAGVEVVTRLCADADVFLQNFRPGVIERLGLDPAALRAANPRLITVSVSGYGLDGPLRDQPVFDPIIQALTGHVAVQVNPEIPIPDLIRNVVVDKCTASYVAQSITAALFHRERTGAAQHIDLSMLDASLYFFWPDGMMAETFLDEGVTQTLTLAERYQLSQCADGPIIMFAGTLKQRLGLFRALGHPEWCDDEELTQPSLSGDPEVLERFGRITAEALVQMTMADAEAALHANDVPCARVVPVAEVAGHEQVVANDSVAEYDDPLVGRVRQPQPPARFAASMAEPGRGFPLPGDHTDEILAELGYDSGAIAELRGSGAVS